MFRGRPHAAVVHLHASPMTAALTWSLRPDDERRDARSSLRRSILRPGRARRPHSIDNRRLIRAIFFFFFPRRLTRETLPHDCHRRTPLIAGPRCCPSSSPSSSSSSRATTLNPHGPAAGADEALPLGVAARNDPAGDTSARRACAMTLLRSPRIKREPVTRRPLLFSSLCYPFAFSLRLSRRAAPRPPGG